MADRDSEAYRQEYQQFLTRLQKFHEGKGTPFKRVPVFGGKELDLLLLYKTATSLGGFSKVTDKKLWKDVGKCLNLPPTCTNAAFALRQHYIRYLEAFERINFLGEDATDVLSDGTKGLGSSWSGMSQESPKKMILGPLGEPRSHNFDRLTFALTSGLPNETDFALNICTLLSNVTNSIFNLAKAPEVVNLLLIHAGVCPEGESSIDLYKEWYQESDRDFIKFWKEAIDDLCVKEIFDSQNLETSADDGHYEDLFCPSSVKSNSVEECRVLQICVILHNFSYEQINSMFLSNHETCLRFLMYCAGSKLCSLRKTALDTLDNISEHTKDSDNAESISIAEWQELFGIITADACQPWTDSCDSYSEYLIIYFDYLIIPFDYLIIG